VDLLVWKVCYFVGQFDFLVGQFDFLVGQIDFLVGQIDFFVGQVDFLVEKINYLVGQVNFVVNFCFIEQQMLIPDISLKVSVWFMSNWSKKKIQGLLKINVDTVKYIGGQIF
jgi:hypothetical protein